MASLIERERGSRERGSRARVSFSTNKNLCQPPDVIASTAVNCGQSNRSVNLGYRERGHGLRGYGGEMESQRVKEKDGFLVLAEGFDPIATAACLDKYC